MELLRYYVRYVRITTERLYVTTGTRFSCLTDAWIELTPRDGAYGIHRRQLVGQYARDAFSLVRQTPSDLERQTRPYSNDDIFINEVTEEAFFQFHCSPPKLATS